MFLNSKMVILSITFALLTVSCGGKVVAPKQQTPSPAENPLPVPGRAPRLAGDPAADRIAVIPANMPVSVYNAIVGHAATIAQKNAVIASVSSVIDRSFTLQGSRDSAIDAAVSDYEWALKIKMALNAADPLRSSRWTPPPPRSQPQPEPQSQYQRPAAMAESIFKTITGIEVPISEAEKIQLIKAIEKALLKTTKVDRDFAITDAVTAANGKSELASKLIKDADAANPILLSIPFGMDNSVYLSIASHPKATVAHKNNIIKGVHEDITWSTTEAQRETRIKQTVLNNGNYEDFAKEIIAIVNKTKPFLMDKPTFGFEQQIYNIIRNYDKATIPEKNIIIQNMKDKGLSYQPRQSQRDQDIDEAVGALHADLAEKIKAEYNIIKPLVMDNPIELGQDIYLLIIHGFSSTAEQKNDIIKNIIIAMKITKKTARTAAIKATITKYTTNSTLLSNITKLVDEALPLLDDMPDLMNQEVFDLIARQQHVTVEHRNKIISFVNMAIRDNPYDQNQRDSIINDAVFNNGNHAGLADLIKAKANLVVPVKPLPSLDTKPADMPQEVYEAIGKFKPGLFMDDKNQALTPIAEAIAKAVGDSSEVSEFKTNLEKSIKIASPKLATLGLSTAILNLYQLKTIPGMSTAVSKVIKNAISTINTIIVLNKFIDDIHAAISNDPRQTAQKLAEVVKKDPELLNLDIEILKALFLVKPPSMPEDVFELIEKYGVEINEGGSKKYYKYDLEKIDALPKIASRIGNPVVTKDTLEAGVDSKLHGMIDEIIGKFYTINKKPAGMIVEIYNAIKMFGGENRNAVDKNTFINNIFRNLAVDHYTTDKTKLLDAVSLSPSLFGIVGDIILAAAEAKPIKPAGISDKLYEIVIFDTATSKAEKEALLKGLTNIENTGIKEHRDSIMADAFKVSKNLQIPAIKKHIESVFSRELPAAADVGLGSNGNTYRAIFNLDNEDKFRNAKLRDIAKDIIPLLDIAKYNLLEMIQQKPTRDNELLEVFAKHAISDKTFKQKVAEAIQMDVPLFEDKVLIKPNKWDAEQKDPAAYGPHQFANTVWATSIYLKDIDWANGKMPVFASEACQELKDVKYNKTKIGFLLHSDVSCESNRFKAGVTITFEDKAFCKAVNQTRWNFIYSKCTKEFGLEKKPMATEN